MGHGNRSLGSWRYRIIKRYRRRATKFRDEAKTIEEFRAWGKVIEWFNDILDKKRINDYGTIVLPEVKVSSLE